MLINTFLGGINPIPNQADVEKIAKSLHVTYELEDNLVDQENSFLFRVTLHHTGNETLKYGNYSIYMYNIRLLQPHQSPYPNGYKLHDCSLWLHHVGGSLYRSVSKGNRSPSVFIDSQLAVVNIWTWNNQVYDFKVLFNTHMYI